MARSVVSYNVLVASPSDVQAERESVTKIVETWNRTHSDAQGVVLRCIRWELDATPELGDRPQAILNRQLVDDCDALVAFVWARVGTPTGVAASGTEEEIARCVARGKPVLLYFASRPPPLGADATQLAQVATLRAHFQSKGLYGSYDTPADFEAKVSEHLARVVHGLRTAPSPDDVSEDDVLVLAALADQRAEFGEHPAP